MTLPEIIEHPPAESVADYWKIEMSNAARKSLLKGVDEPYLFVAGVYRTIESLILVLRLPIDEVMPEWLFNLYLEKKNGQS